MNLRYVITKIKDKTLREKVNELLQDPRIRIGDTVYEGLPLRISPASKGRHHSYEGGLIQHILSSSTIGLVLCDVVERIYHAKVDRDTVLAAIITHDLMKPVTYCFKQDGGVNTSQVGEQLDHLTLVVSELIRRGFPLNVVHAVAAHHGKDSPVSPHTIEALICFLADSTDATLNGEVLNAARYLVSRYVGEEATQLNADEAFSIVNMKQSHGYAGIKSLLEEIKLKRETRRAPSRHNQSNHEMIHP